jgi:hypothetical protein
MKEKTKEMREDWSNKYKKSIDCNNPKGFSQKAHCQARKLRSMGKKTESKPINEARVDKHEVSGKVVIDGHVFSDAGKSGRSTYGRYSVKDPNYVKDPKEVGMHRNYRRPSSLLFSTLNDAKKWVKTQPKKSKEEIDRLHKKHADFEKSMNEDAPVNVVGGGAIAGLGVGPQGEPGVNMKKKRKVIPFAMFVRKKPN